MCVAAVSLIACDNVDSDDRYIKVDTVETKRAVLIEEFTGQECSNCPDGHAIMASIREQYGESVIPVSIHASRLSYLETDGGLGIPEGQTLYENAGSPNLPSAVIDRNSGAIGREDWSARVRAELERESDIEIELAAALVDGVINIHADLKTVRDLKCNLNVWVVESGIVSFQLSGHDFVMDYEHNHVLRAVVNGIDGAPLTLVEGETTGYDCSVPLKSTDMVTWNPDNLSIVAFATDATGVMQAVETKLIVDTAAD